MKIEVYRVEFDGERFFNKNIPVSIDSTEVNKNNSNAFIRRTLDGAERAVKYYNSLLDSKEIVVKTCSICGKQCVLSKKELKKGDEENVKIWKCRECIYDKL